ncbi:MAG: hypothetical protein ABIQ95_08675 [Bdellovibrionia bacterium]
MIWKPKEKELTPEEAVAIAKKDLAPFWFGSSPLLAGFAHEGHSLIVPLSSEFVKKNWMILLIDPTDFEGENAIFYAKEWYRRYHQNNFGFIIVLVPSYEYMRLPASIQKLMEKQQISFPLVLDAEGTLAHALNATKLPKTVLLNQGRVIQAYEGDEDFKEIENHLQKFLRSLDPGLALLPLFSPKEARVVDVDRYEFGYKPKIGSPVMTFPSPGFVVGEDKIRRAKFVHHRDGNEEGEGLSKFIISGEWQQYPEGIVTSDPNAYIQLTSPAERVSLIAAPAGKAGLEPPRISVEVGGRAVYDAISGEDLKMEDSGESQVRVVKPLFYHILVNLPKDHRKVVLRFLNAKRGPIALYGIRFGGKYSSET